jgi:vacuolar-type H+-ATPase subunit E/Vma4
MSKREQEVYTTPSQMQRDHQEAINRTFDQTRTNVRKTVNEAKKDISMYSEQFTNMQERAIETTRDIAENYIDSQREIFNSYNQAVVTPYIENVMNRIQSFPGAFSPSRAEVYGNTFSNLVENYVTATRLMSKTVFANAGLINASLQQASNNVREYSRIGVNAAKNVHETANEMGQIGQSIVESTATTRRNQ